MHKYITTLFLLLIMNSSFGDELHYYSRFPEFMDEDVLICDNYVRNNYESFEKDTLDILFAYKEHKWELLNTLMQKYIKNNEATSVLDEQFIKSIGDCGRSYVFSDKVNYYRELETKATLFFVTVNTSMNNKNCLSDDINSFYDTMINYLHVIIKSTNKTATKTTLPTHKNSAIDH